jgi:integrase
MIFTFSKTVIDYLVLNASFWASGAWRILVASPERSRGAAHSERSSDGIHHPHELHVQGQDRADIPGSLLFRVRYQESNGTKRELTFKKRKDAKAFYDTIDETPTLGRVDHDLTIADGCKIWLDTCKVGCGDPVEPHTHRMCESHVRVHIIPRIGPHSMSAMTQKILRSLKSAFSECRAQGKIVNNPTGDVRMAISKRNKEPVVIPSRKEVAALIRTADDLVEGEHKRFEPHTWRRWRAMLMVFCSTGMRASEVRGLKRENVDLESGLINVVERANENGAIGAPKSASGRRSIDIDDYTADVLQAWHGEQGGNGLVFGTWKGTVENHANIVNRMW